MTIIAKIIFYLCVTIVLIALWKYVKIRYPKANIPFLVFLFFYRIPFSFIFINFIPGDWNIYYSDAVSGLKLSFGLGTDSIYFFTRPLVLMNLSVPEIFLFYSFLGYIGLVLIYLVGHKLTNYTDKVSVWGINLFPWILLYPSLHMFTVMLGKDPIVLLGLGLVCYSLITIPLRKLYLVIGLLLMLVVRPHLTIVVFASLYITLLLSGEWGKVKKFMLTLLAPFAIVAMVPITVAFFRLNSFSIQAIQLALLATEGHSTDANTYVDMSSYPLPLKMFTYLFRPLFVDASNFMLQIYSVENLFFLLLTLNLVRLSFISWIKNQPLILKFSIVYFLIGTMIFCNALSVFGLFMRQKTMVFLFLLLIIFAFIHHRNQKKIYRIKPANPELPPSHA